MLKKIFRALAVGSAAVGAGTLAEFGVTKIKADLPKAVKVGSKFAGAAVGAAIGMAIVK